MALTWSFQLLVAYVVVGLVIAAGSAAVHDVVVSAEGRTLIPAMTSLRRRELEGQRIERVGGWRTGQVAMMRRVADWPAAETARQLHAQAAEVLVHPHVPASLTEREYNATPGNARTVAVAVGANSTAGAAGNATANSTVNSGGNMSSSGSGDATANASSLANRSNRSHAVPVPTVPPGPFVLRTPVLHMSHQATTIVPEQWPPVFCIDMKFVAPDGNTPERRRCLALFGGNKTCGSFYLYINDVNEVGMGVRCEDGGHDGDGPLLNDDGGMSSFTTHFLQFCYNTHNNEASIWKDSKLGVSAKKRWRFERRGFVSLFVGSHVLESTNEGLYRRDRAKILELRFQDNSTAPTTTTTTTTTTTGTTTTGTTTADKRIDITTTRWHANVITTPKMEEVDVNQSLPTPEEVRVIGLRRRYTTPKPYWSHKHHEKVLNSTVSVSNKSVRIHDDTTVVTKSGATATSSHSRVISIPGAPPVNGSVPHKITIHSSSVSAGSATVTGR